MKQCLAKMYEQMLAKIREIMFVFRYKDTPLFEIGRILRREGPLTKQMIIESQDE